MQLEAHFSNFCSGWGRRKFPLLSKNEENTIECYNKQKQPESFGHLNYFWSLRFHVCQVVTNKTSIFFFSTKIQYYVKFYIPKLLSSRCLFQNFKKPFLMTGMYFNPILHLNMTRKRREQKLLRQSHRQRYCTYVRQYQSCVAHVSGTQYIIRGTDRFCQRLLGDQNVNYSFEVSATKKSYGLK